MTGACLLANMSDYDGSNKTYTREFVWKRV